MSAKFGEYTHPNGQYWTPDYGGVNWQLLHERLVADGRLEPYQPVGFDSGDGLVIESNQEVLVFRTNDVAPDMDMVAHADPRDGADYIWFREDNPEHFENLFANLGHAALKMHTRYPLPDTVTIYLDRRSAGNDIEFLEASDE